MPRRSLDKMFEAALAAAEAAQTADKSIGRRKTKVNKTPCPAERVVQTDEGLRCTTEGRVSRVKIGPFMARVDKRGNVTRPAPLVGLAAEAMPALARDLKASRQFAKECEGLERPLRHQSFANAGAALAALYKANSGLGDKISRIWGSKLDEAYNRWVKGGMRGPRPTLFGVYGTTHTENLPNLDFLRGFSDRPGRKRKIYAITEALYASTPASRRWDDWLPVLLALQAEVNSHAQGDSYIRPWHELVIPGRPGKAIEVRRQLEGSCQQGTPSPSEIVQKWKRKPSPDAGRDAGDDDGDAPF